MRESHESKEKPIDGSISPALENSSASPDSELSFQDYIENAPYGVFVTDETGHYILVNGASCAITGYLRSELLGMHVLDTAAPENHDEAMKHFQTVVDTGKSIGDLKYVHKNGQTRWWTVNAVKLNEKRYIGFTLDITEAKEAEKEKELLIQELKDALAQVKKLSGFIPICASCKKIRDDTGYWRQVEEYVMAHSEAEFSHGICPDCMRRLYPDYADEVLEDVSYK